MTEQITYGRTTPTLMKIQGRMPDVPAWAAGVCSECGSVVIDKDTHQEFHDRLKVAS